MLNLHAKKNVFLTHENFNNVLKIWLSNCCKTVNSFVVENFLLIFFDNVVKQFHYLLVNFFTHPRVPVSRVTRNVRNDYEISRDDDEENLIDEFSLKIWNKYT